MDWEAQSENLPAFVVMLDGGIKSGPPVYGAGFLPAAYQGTVLRNGPAPILNVRPPEHTYRVEAEGHARASAVVQPAAP